MNRRKFLTASGILAGLTILSPRKVVASVTQPQKFRKCRVTVIRRTCFQDIQGRYLDDPEEGRCPKFREGDSFICSDSSLPKGFCPNAWQAVSHHVKAVTQSSCTLTCGSAPTDGAVIACCSDGTRPVIFKIEPIQ